MLIIWWNDDKSYLSYHETSLGLSIDVPVLVAEFLSGLDEGQHQGGSPGGLLDRQEAPSSMVRTAREVRVAVILRLLEVMKNLETDRV